MTDHLDLQAFEKIGSLAFFLRLEHDRCDL
jgi:hypothetical protein